MGWPELLERAALQNGVLRIPDVKDDGVTPGAFRKKAKRERWRMPVRNVAVSPTAPRSHEQRAAIHVFSLGEEAMATRHTAAHLYGLIRDARATVDVVIRHGRDDPKRIGLRILRSSTLEDGDRSWVKGVPCASVPRMLLDLAMVCTKAELRRYVVDALQRRLVTLDQIVERFGRVGPVAGRGRLREVCYELDASRCDSIFERIVRRWLRANGFDPDPHPVSHTGRGITIHVDIGFTRCKVGVECKGFAFHSSREQLTKDGRRSNTTALITDWTILVIDWDRFENDPEGFLDELRAAIAAAGV